MAVIGYTATGRKWAPELEVSTLEAPAEQFVLDKALKPVGVDPRFPTDILVIPRGRLVGVSNGSVTSGSGSATLNANFVDGDTVLTLADGVSVAPLGFAGYNMYMKRSADTAQWAPAMFKSRLIRLPYTTTGGANAFSNAIYGDIAPGDAITAYYGGSTAALGRHKGKIVKYVPKQVYSTWTVTASTTVLLTDAVLPGIQPKVVAAFGTTATSNFTAASGTTTGSLGGDTIGTVTWVAASACWKVVTSAAVNCVVWQYGQDDFMKAGTCLGIEKLDSDMPGWLKWVTDNFGMWDLPPIQLPGYTTYATISNGTGLTAVSVATDNNQFSIDAISTSHPFANYKPYTVKINQDCIAYDMNAVATVAPAAGLELVENVNFTINPITGTITIINCTQTDGTPILKTDIDVTYYYENPKNGLSYDGGQLYLTDGSGGTYAGVPAAYDIAGSVGIMKVMVE